VLPGRGGTESSPLNAFGALAINRDCHVALALLDAPSTYAKASADKRNDKIGWIPAHHAAFVMSGMTAI